MAMLLINIHCKRDTDGSRIYSGILVKKILESKNDVKFRK